MRPVALGRKNWIHIGSPLAGPKVAAILSFVESCGRLKVPPSGFKTLRSSLHFSLLGERRKRRLGLSDWQIHSEASED